APLEPGDLCLFVAEPSPIPAAKYYAGREGDNILLLATNPEVVISVPLASLRYCHRVEYLRTATALPVAPERNDLAIAIAAYLADTELCLEHLPDMRPAEATTAVLTEIRRRWLECSEAPTGADFLRAFVG
ncbi:hypothetical protein BZU93_28985, partial [Salmonella enterica subsp. enterica]|nr:hypothetical protein [Salmonella enterica subsp. enterica serovar Enteritidis]